MLDLALYLNKAIENINILLSWKPIIKSVTFISTELAFSTILWKMNYLKRRT